MGARSPLSAPPSSPASFAPPRRPSLTASRLLSRPPTGLPAPLRLPQSVPQCTERLAGPARARPLPSAPPQSREEGGARKERRCRRGHEGVNPPRLLPIPQRPRGGQKLTAAPECCLGGEGGRRPLPTHARGTPRARLRRERGGLAWARKGGVKAAASGETLHYPPSWLSARMGGHQVIQGS